jgi:DNA (cytosine-5)-methyltransferase 1
MGYHRAGFEVVGVDSRPQQNYPFEFQQADAFSYLEQHGHEFDVIHASPPCQAYSHATPNKSKHPDLVAAIREAIKATGKPFVIENVPGAPLHFPITLCGTMFGLCDIEESVHLRRHRQFESPQLVLSPGGCHCRGVDTAHVTGHMGKISRHPTHGIQAGYREAKTMMGIDWMTRDELAQAIPPAYTEWIGKQLVNWMHNRAD